MAALRCLLTQEEIENRYLFMFFPLLLVHGEMQKAFLHGNEPCPSEVFQFRIETVIRTERKTDQYLFIRFAFLLVGEEVQRAFLFQNEPFLFENIHVCWEPVLRA